MSWKTSQYDENPFADESQNGGRPSSGAPKKISLGTPPWLQDPESNSSPTTGGNTAQMAGEPIPLDPTVPRMILYTRVINLILSICMIIVSLLSVLTTQSATTGVLACYVTVFACLLCCFETHLKQVSKLIALNFGFMYSAKSRSVFMLFVGTILFSFSLFGKIIGIAMIVNAFFNGYIIVRYPQFEDAQRSDAQSDIQEYLAANPAFAEKIISTGVSVGVDLAKSNPEMVQQGSQAMFSAAANSQRSRAANDAGPSYTSV